MFWTRLLSGIVLTVLALGFFLAGAPYLTIGLMLISCVGFKELMQVLSISGAGAEQEKKKAQGPEWIGYCGIVLYYLAILATDFGWVAKEMATTFYLACIVAVLLAELFAYVVAFPKYRVEQITGAVFAFLYAPLMLSFIGHIRSMERGIFLVWLVLICSWGSDTFAYCVGMLIGKKKIFPVLSPKKSLEGCIGGVLGAALLGFVYGYFCLTKDMATLAVIAIICAVGAVFSMVGDLAASAIKRNKGIKDYGKLIPGHGGIMDRFDSVIVAAPMIYFLLVFFL